MHELEKNSRSAGDWIGINDWKSNIKMGENELTMEEANDIYCIGDQ